MPGSCIRSAFSSPVRKIPPWPSPHFDTLLKKIETRTARAGIIGLGYVGLPLAMAVARSGFAVTGFDIDPRKIVALNAGRSYIEAVTRRGLLVEIDAGPLQGDDRFRWLCRVRRHHHLRADAADQASRAGSVLRRGDIALDRRKHLRPGQLVVLESTTYPGTTDEVVQGHSRKHRPEIRRGLLPRLFAGARGPRQSALSHRDHPEGRRRRRRRGSGADEGASMARR